MSFYECLKALPESSDSASRLALAARRLGYGGIIICNAEPERIFRPDAASSISGIEVTFGADITAPNPRVLRSRVSSLRSRYPFVMVEGRSEEMIRAACEDPNVDMLMHMDEGRRPLGIAAAKSAKQNQVAIGFDLSPIIRLRGSFRSRWLDVQRRSIDHARKFDLSMMITANARSHLDLRAPRDLVALAEVMGLEDSEAKEALMLPGKLLDLNQRNWQGPGVELL
jgi:ribonuclease P/MRP protein subunit RPP1